MGLIFCVTSTDIDILLFLLGFLLLWMIFTIEERTVEKVCKAGVYLCIGLSRLCLSIVPVRRMIFRLFMPIFHFCAFFFHVILQGHHQSQQAYIVSHVRNLPFFETTELINKRNEHVRKEKYHKQKAQRHLALIVFNLLEAMRQLCEFPLQLLQVIPPVCYVIFHLLESVFCFLISLLNPVQEAVKRLSEDKSFSVNQDQDQNQNEETSNSHSTSQEPESHGRSNGKNVLKDWFRIEHQRIFFTEMVLKHWNKPPQHLVESNLTDMFINLWFMSASEVDLGTKPRVPKV
ncbi:uncharacterized protein LOC120539767 [Polypterus senegalus]|uniref:uncharacterized protein LOC120539767 n=1 Tax=Polypterus senegalus TaxID=55291 RepID=UPI0019641F4E|nr:uncharacterized protein LOC120539767 [Polypterus senegalus]